jgi:hypothetical protein
MSANVQAIVAKNAWDLVYRVSPILLTGGLASSLTSSFSSTGLFGAVLSSISDVGIPIAALLDPLGLLSSGTLDIDGLFAHFSPMPGGTLLDFESGDYPFANQTVASNNMIQRELIVSMQMECAYRGSASMLTRIAALAAFQATISEHVVQGGRFTVLTPAMIYTNALLLQIIDISNDPVMPQTNFQLNFKRPLITTQDAAAAASTFVSKLTGGQPSDGNWIQAASGNPAASLLGSLF